MPKALNDLKEGNQEVGNESKSSRNKFSIIEYMLEKYNFIVYGF